MIQIKMRVSRLAYGKSAHIAHNHANSDFHSDRDGHDSLIPFKKLYNADVLRALNAAITFGPLVLLRTEALVGVNHSYLHDHMLYMVDLSFSSILSF
jgi:hypothetical protein